MPGKAKVGKKSTHSGAKKRSTVTGTGKVSMQKAAHRHRLNQKATRQKTMGGRQAVVSEADAKRFKSLLWK